MISFVNANKNLALSLATHRSFRGFLVNFASKEVAAILSSTQQPGSVFVMSGRPRDFVQMASDKPLVYGCS